MHFMHEDFFKVFTGIAMTMCDLRQIPVITIDCIYQLTLLLCRQPSPDPFKFFQCFSFANLNSYSIAVCL